jgi:uncharacterized protein with HEPN domain
MQLVDGKTIESFKTDDVLHEAILRHLTIIGEAAKNLPEDLRDQEPHIPWRKIARLRDLLVHVYFGIKDEIVWKILTEDLDDLRDASQRMLERLDSR